MTKTTFDATLHGLTMGMAAAYVALTQDPDAATYISPEAFFWLKIVFAFCGGAGLMTIGFRSTSYADSLPPDASSGPDMKAIADHVNKAIDDRVIPIKNTSGDHVATAIMPSPNPIPTGP